MLSFNFPITLVDLAEQSGAVLKHMGHEWRGCCPLHGGSDPSAFVIFEDGGKERWSCFSGDCGSGDIVDFYKAFHGCDFMTAYKALGGDVKTNPEEVARLSIERARKAEHDLEEKISAAQRALADLRSAQSWLKYHDTLDNNQEARRIWRNKGIPDVWQDIFELGYTDNFTVSTPEGSWNTPTLTIPIFDAGRELINVRHRLLKPYKPNDKYRPDRPGLPSAPFMCDPENGWNIDHVLVCEGEIKAAVTYITLDSPKWQILGIPGKTWKGDLVDELKEHQVWVCLDPDATEQAIELAKAVKGRIIYLADKIDDAIQKKKLNKEGIRKLIKDARTI